MRDLTEEELKLAPEWATHYQARGESRLIWESYDKYQTKLMDKPKKQNSKLTKCRKIPTKKPFDISEHEFSDSIAEIKARVNAGSTITLDVFEKWVMLNKPDVIAIAKALGVTGDDLK